jgi:hypothetical protein
VTGHEPSFQFDRFTGMAASVWSRSPGRILVATRYCVCWNGLDARESQRAETYGAVRRTLAAAEPAGSISQAPLAARSAARDGPLFETLNANQIGLDFFHQN